MHERCTKDGERRRKGPDKTWGFLRKSPTVDRITAPATNCTAARLNGPSRLNGQADDRGRAQTVGDFDIAFDVYSQTNACAASDLVSAPGRKAWGALYEVPADFIRGKRPDGQKTLAEIEGARYEEKPIQV